MRLTEVQVVFFDIGDTLARPRIAGGRLASLEPLPGVINALDRLRAAGFRLGIISNTGAETRESMRRALEEGGLYRFFEAEPELLIYSSVVGRTKDSPEIFRQACTAAGLGGEPEHCLYVGEDEDERGVAVSANLRVAASVADVAEALSRLS
jgi:FMN phosphatase YigB (HAD superfamily)